VTSLQPAVSGAEIKRRKTLRLRGTPNQGPIKYPPSVRKKLLRDDLLMRVRIEAPPSDPARLNNQDRQLLNQIIALFGDEKKQRRI
jgi:hypothetical protein